MDDLSTLFVAYVEGLRDNAVVPPGRESTTLVVKDQPTIRLSDVTDLNTAYYEALN
jgi:hypothetical protein